MSPSKPLRMTTTATSTPIKRISYRDASRIQHAGIAEADVRDHHIELGAILRIADALEAMAADRAALVHRCASLEQEIKDADAIIRHQSSQLTGLRGAIARNKLAVST